MVYKAGLSRSRRLQFPVLRCSFLAVSCLALSVFSCGIAVGEKLVARLSYCVGVSEVLFFLH